MTFRIERLIGGENAIVLRVCGRMDVESVNTIRELIGEEKSDIPLDLEEVTLADRDAVRFLAISELEGVELKNCPAFLREWVSKNEQYFGVVYRRPRVRSVERLGPGRNIWMTDFLGRRILAACL